MALNKCLENVEESGAHDSHRCWLTRPNPLASIALTHDDEARARRAERAAMRDGVSHFAPLQEVYAHSTLGESALTLIAEIAPPRHPARRAALNFIDAHLQMSSLDEARRDWLSTWLWDHLDMREGLAPLLPYARQILQGHPERAELLAVRLALITPDEALDVCQALQSLPQSERASFGSLLERQLKRVGKISLWVGCREALAGRRS